ncbi:stage V sporulation protein AC [Orenia metallireducens]|jgi:stage V sporulation protein AC|uniref:Stage V sporulation protein AC n=1 Tax=Orenia metallireducens TaxID=1413210 RepID=A0A285GSK4_9FIRM|nr:stage V sporulation protein AC [Orenia metallireducens]PRX32624.1 stage V sporulation protein AC [Orenia metallireducens]SNY26542.1 stage V sporulation protein AC [Orenia metallireducens]
MSNKKNKKLTPTQQQYQAFAKAREPEPSVVRNCLRAFLVGGLICTFGQALQMMFINYFNFTEETAGDPTVAVLIIISTLLTGFGMYDHIAQWAGAGTIIPVTGFANTVASASIEHRSEGFVLGVGGNMFKLAGSVIAYGVFSAFVVAIIKITIQALGGM